jgi:cytochrome c5
MFSPKVLTYLSLTAVFLVMAPKAVDAQPISGQAVYEKACIACHGAGVAGAPKFGDKKAWAKLIKEPQFQLTAHGYVGVRGMPAKGGQADLSVEDFAKAVVHMARAAGSQWQDPDVKLLAKINQEIIVRERDVKKK